MDLKLLLSQWQDSWGSETVVTYETTMTNLGFGDVNEMTKFNDNDLNEMKTDLVENGIKTGHAMSIRRVLRELREGTPPILGKDHQLGELATKQDILVTEVTPPMGEGLRRYVREHRVELLLTEALQKAAELKAANPIEFIGNFMLEKSGTRKSEKGEAQRAKLATLHVGGCSQLLSCLRKCGMGGSGEGQEHGGEKREGEERSGEGQEHGAEKREGEKRKGEEREVEDCDVGMPSPVPPEKCYVMISFNDGTAGVHAERASHFLTRKNRPTFCTRLFCPSNAGSWRHITTLGACQCEYMVVLMTNGWQKSKECQYEIDIAENRRAKGTLTIIPVWFQPPLKTADGQVKSGHSRENCDSRYDYDYSLEKNSPDFNADSTRLDPPQLWSTAWGSLQAVFRSSDTWLNDLLELIPEPGERALDGRAAEGVEASQKLQREIKEQAERMEMLKQENSELARDKAGLVLELKGKRHDMEAAGEAARREVERVTKDARQKEKEHAAKVKEAKRATEKAKEEVKKAGRLKMAVEHQVSAAEAKAREAERLMKEAQKLAEEAHRVRATDAAAAEAARWAVAEAERKMIEAKRAKEEAEEEVKKVKETTRSSVEEHNKREEAAMKDLQVLTKEMEETERNAERVTEEAAANIRAAKEKAEDAERMVREAQKGLAVAEEEVARLTRMSQEQAAAHNVALEAAAEEKATALQRAMEAERHALERMEREAAKRVRAAEQRAEEALAAKAMEERARMQAERVQAAAEQRAEEALAAKAMEERARMQAERVQAAAEQRAEEAQLQAEKVKRECEVEEAAREAKAAEGERQREAQRIAEEAKRKERERQAADQRVDEALAAKAMEERARMQAERVQAAAEQRAEEAQLEAEKAKRECEVLLQVEEAAREAKAAEGKRQREAQRIAEEAKRKEGERQAAEREAKAAEAKRQREVQRIAEEAKRNEAKRRVDLGHISLVICGHVDSGKSTTTGRLLFELGGITEREMEKLKAEADRLGKPSFAFAFYMDRQKEERERGVTISCTTKEFITEKWRYTIIDAPGHPDFIKNMISGAGQADVALLMVPADGNFTTAIQKGNLKASEVQGQSRQHARLLNALGVKQLIIGVNKMDTDAAGPYSKARYDEVGGEMTNMLIKVGWKRDYVGKSVPVLPISGWMGDNLIKKTVNMDWWSGMDIMPGMDRHGYHVDKKAVHIDTLYDCLNDACSPPGRNESAAMRMPVSGIYRIKGVGDVIAGRIEQGVVKPNEEVIFMPTHTPAKACGGRVFTIEMNHTGHEVAKPGDNVGLNIKGLDKQNMPCVGDVMIYKKDSTLDRCGQFTAQIQTLDIPGEIKIGYSPIGFVRCGRSACRAVKFNFKVGKETGGKKMERPQSLKSNEMAEVVFQPQQPLVVDSYRNCEGLSRVAFLDGNTAVMLGKVTALVYYKDMPQEGQKGKKD